MVEYAIRTKVPATRSRLEIEEMMRRRGADQFVSGADSHQAMLAFRLNGRYIRFSLPLSDIKTEQRLRSRWRALWLVVKAKLEAVDQGILTIEDAFLQETVLPDKRTVAEYMLPQIASVYSSGEMPPLLPFYGGSRDQ